MSVADVPESAHKKKYCFAVVTAKKTYFLHSETAEVTTAWMKVLMNQPLKEN